MAQGLRERLIVARPCPQSLTLRGCVPSSSGLLRTENRSVGASQRGDRHPRRREFGRLGHQGDSVTAGWPSQRRHVRPQRDGPHPPAADA